MSGEAQKEQLENAAKSLVPAILKAIKGTPPIVAANALLMAMRIVDAAEARKK